MTEEVKPLERTEPSQKDLDAMGVTADAIKLDDVQMMGQLVTGWHHDMVSDFAHKLNMPDDVGIDIPTGDIDANGNEVVIDGNADHRLGFLTGLAYALERMNTFPIKGVPEDGEG